MVLKSNKKGLVFSKDNSLAAHLYLFLSKLFVDRATLFLWKGDFLKPFLIWHLSEVPFHFYVILSSNSNETLFNKHPQKSRQKSRIGNLLYPSFGPYSSPSFPAKYLLDRGWNWTCDILLKNFHHKPCLAAIFVLKAKVGISAWEKSFPRNSETLSV